MRNIKTTNPFDFSDLLKLEDVLSDFSSVETALLKHKCIILTDKGSWKYALMDMDEYEHYLAFKQEEEQRSVEKQLPILLNGIGKRFFVGYYHELKQNYPAEYFLAKEDSMQISSIRSRLSRARVVFVNGWEINALRFIIDSPRVDENSKKKAFQLMHDEMK